MKTFTLQDILPFLGEGYQVEGDSQDVSFTHVATIMEAKEDTLVWLNPNRADKLDLLKQTAARIIICSEDVSADDAGPDKVLVKVKDPKLSYLRTVEAFFIEKPAYGVHPTAYIEPTAKIHPNTFIGPYTYVGEAEIGEGCVIKSHCHIGNKTVIHRNVTIHSGTVIGADGFGYARNEQGELEKFPHIGGVVIEENVEIGANTCIDRGTLGNTWIKAGAKIDNLVHIAHNVEVGKDTAVIANAMIGGSTRIGDKSWIAPSACVRDAINIGSDSVVGLGALVTKSIPDNEVWAGFPAKKIR